jgi:hypothetical protein
MYFRHCRALQAPAGDREEGRPAKRAENDSISNGTVSAFINAFRKERPLEARSP